jgi:hypothetical protein
MATTNGIRIMANRFLPLIASLILGLSATVTAPHAQQQPVDEVEDGEAILTEEVEDSGVEAEPDEQGMRPHEAVEADDHVDLYSLLQAVRHAPPGLDGAPITRPNALASEPETEMTPAQPRDAYLFPDDFIE